MEVHLWRALHGNRHPLPARSAGLALALLGDPAERALLADKLATAEILGTRGLKSPSLHGLWRADVASRPDVGAAATDWCFWHGVKEPHSASFGHTLPNH